MFNIEILELMILFGVPTSITGLLLWYIKKRLDGRDTMLNEYKNNMEQMMLMIIQNTKSTNYLATLTAKAIQRIPDVEIDDEFEEAIRVANNHQEEQKDFLYNQGVKRVFTK